MLNKHVFAAYLNQATHNYHLLLNDIAQRIGKKVIDEENLQSHPIIQLLSDSKDARQPLRAINALNKGLGFIERLQRRIMAYRYFSSVKTETAETDQKKKHIRKSQEYSLLPNDYAFLLKLLASTLNYERNYATHAYHPPKSPDQNLVGFLYDIFDMAVRVCKTRHQLNEHDLKHLRRKIRNPDKSKDAPKSIIDPGFKYCFTDSEGFFTDYGRAFLTCLFLNKQDSYHFLKQLSGFKSSHTAAHKATLKVFTCYSIRLPNERIDNSTDTQTLGLDMLNELARCPSLLFPVLSKADQAAYEIPVEDAEQNQTDDGNEILFIRHGERFIPLMMRYFDETKAFEKLRFHIDLGDFYFAAYPKTLYDDVKDTRRLKQKLHTFARLNEVEQAPIPQEWQALIKDNREITNADLNPYLVDTTPHYHLLDDNVALKVVKPNQAIYPQLLPHETIENRYKSPSNEQPDFWLSKHEMLHLSFFQLLREKHPALHQGSIEQLVFQQYKEALHRCFDKLAEQPARYTTSQAIFDLTQQYTYSPLKQAIMPDEIPKVIRDALMNKRSRYQANALSTISTLMNIGEKRLAALERSTSADKKDKSNRPGDKKQRPVKAGVMGEDLADDIVRFQPPQDESDNKGKPTSLIVAELQARLAFYGRDKAQLPNLCTAMKLIDNADASKNHPFLATVLKESHAGIIGFYQSYYRARTHYLQRVETDITQNASHISHYHWLKTPTRDKPDFNVKRHIEKLKAQPVNLPRGLFFPYIKHALLQLNHAVLTHAIEQSEKLNTSYLIALYYTHVLQDKPQVVYEKKREYKLVAQAYDNRTNQFQALSAHAINTQQPYGSANALHTKIKEHLQEKYPTESKTQQQAAYRKFEQNEKNIRAVRTQDQVLFLASQQLLALNHGLNQEISQLKLHQLDKTLLDKQTSYQLAIHGKTISQAQIRIKKIGEFRRFLKDRRLKGLLNYYASHNIPREVIAKELEAYQRCRLQVFERLHAFELQSHQRYGLDAHYKGSEHGQLLSAYFKAQPQADAETKMHCMLVLRNAFAHNQYPTQQSQYPRANTMLDLAKQQLADTSAPQVAEYFLNQIESLYPAPLNL
ncbi:type VI-B CRISPR-associated RNA-guided ribonuclease Cas13b [Methylophilus aquaticus]|uniref:Type VI-B CRISPR-associated RNA-guided ribonuclease Cas13b n=1 Tax=Methylophilus aquaticus TaxID=1971610 RepID=A0ABT9JQF6_9PROT|nr:type VI-B CRISPR-associated RNA-guided ribonuclease Cas13b [Methylophilus aquaticus]MDP8566788.1 type VI-B CRISPR-associated RNA-guided ribonuclease Cas13b [Methylophilus aquaticus]